MLNGANNMKEMIRELIDYRQLLYMLTWRDIKLRYKQSVMGFMWAILMPMLIVAAGITIKMAFSFMAGKSIVSSDRSEERRVGKQC